MPSEPTTDGAVLPYENILFEVQDGVGVLTLNRPKALNTLNSKTLDELSDVIARIARDNDVRALVLTGAGEKAFAAGADITEFSRMSPLQARQFSTKAQEIFFALERLPRPVIACVNGFALGGGCELAMSCDFIYASDRAKFGQPEANLGLLPGFGGTQRLPRLIGVAKAKELCMTGEFIDAQQAKELGLVAKVFAADQLVAETMKVARALAKGPASLSAIKRVINRGAEVDLKSGCALEAEAFGLNFANQDSREGIVAFLEKRKPEFKGC
jgi:enoyl-CoA hydratase